MSVTKHSHTQNEKNVVMNIHKGYKCSLYKQLATFLDGFKKKSTLLSGMYLNEKSH